MSNGHLEDDKKSPFQAEDVVHEVKKAFSAAPATVDTLAQSPMFPVAAYCLASIFMTVLNKFVVSGTGFSMNFLLLCIQSSVCVACVWTSKSLGVISYREFNMNDAKRWFPISTLLVAVIYTGSKSLQYLSIPVYTIFKNLTIILIAYGEMYLSGSAVAPVTPLTLVAFVIMVLSSVIAAWSDISNAMTSPWVDAAAVSTKWRAGYMWMFLNCLFTAANALAMRRRMKALSFKDWDTMFYNNVLSIPTLALASLIIEDWSGANLSRNFPEDTRGFLLFAIMVSGAGAVFISYTTAWCIRATSSTTYSMVGALNKLPVAASGMLFFGDPVTLGSVSAIGTGFFAGIVYAIAKNEQGKTETREKDVILPMHQRR